MPPQTNERLNIQVHESGSSNVVEMFNRIAAEARQAVVAIRKLRKEIGGKGTLSEARKGSRGGKGAAARTANKEANAQIAAIKRVEAARIRAAESARKHNVGVRNRSVAIAAREEAKALRRATVASNKHSRSLNRLTNTVAKTSSGMRGLGNQVFFAQRAFAALGGLFVVRGFLQLSDQFQNMTNRIRLVTKSSEQFTMVQLKLQQIANDTRQSLTATTETYVRLRKATESSGVSQDRLFGVMTTLNQMLAVSGTTAIEAEQSIRQLSQAFSKGKLDGDEFRSVSEAMPAILTALEVSLGKTRGELRDMSEAGQLTTQVLLEAFEAVKDSAFEDFEKSIVTIGQSWVVLKNNVLKAVGEFNTSTGAIGLLVKMVMLLAENLWIVGLALQALAGFAFVKMIQGARVLLALISTKMIPAMTLYINKLLVANAIAKQAAISEMALSGSRHLSTLGVSMSAIAGTVGVIGTAALLAGAAFAGWKIGTFLDDIFGLSNMLAGLDASELTKTLQEALELALSRNEVELKSVKTGEAIGRLERDIKRDKLRQLDINKRIWSGQLEEVKRLPFKKIAEANISQELAAQESMRKSSLSILDKARGRLTPLRKIQKDIAAEILKAQLAMLHLGGNTVEAEEAAIKLGVALKAATVDQRNPIKALIKERKAELVILNKITEAEREKASLLADTAKTQRDALGTDADTDAGRAQLEELRTVTRELEARRRELGKGGKGPKDNTAKALRALKEGLDPVLAALNQVKDATKLLDKAERKKLITTEENIDLLLKVKKSLEDQLHPMKALLKITAQDAMFASEGTKAAEDRARIELIKAELFKNTGEELGFLQNKLVSVVNWFQKYTATTKAGVVETEKLAAALRGKLEPTLKALADGTLGQSKEMSKVNKLIKERNELNKLSLDIFNSERGEIDARIKTEEDLGRVYKANSEVLDIYITRLHEKSLQANADLANIRADIAAATDSWSAFNALFTDEALIGLEQGFLANAFLSLEDQIVSMTTTGAFSFKEMVDSMLADITRLTIRMAIAGVFNPGGRMNLESEMSSRATLAAALAAARLAQTAAAQATIAAAKAQAAAASVGGAGGAGADGGAGAIISGLSIAFGKHGKTLLSANLPRFAHGGGMQVGGTGGPDTKLVQFMASPGENIRVTNPGQSRLDNRQHQPQEPTPITINNITDPADIAAALASPAGKRAIMNTIQQNGATVRKLLR